MGQASKRKWLKRAARDLGPTATAADVIRFAGQKLEAKRDSIAAWAEWEQRRLWGLFNLELRAAFESTISTRVYRNNALLSILDGRR